jgi:hypothetical protein
VAGQIAALALASAVVDPAQETGTLPKPESASTWRGSHGSHPTAWLLSTSTRASTARAAIKAMHQRADAGYETAPTVAQTALTRKFELLPVGLL